jgi:hypothetical protein
MMKLAIAFLPVALAGSAELNIGNVRSGASFDNLKASWGKALEVAGFKTNLDCKYDYSENKEGLKEMSLTGDLLEAANDDDIAVGYKLTRHVASKKNDIKLMATTKGTTIYGEYNDNQLAEVGASREVEIGDQKVNVEPSYKVQAKTARVKLMSALSGGKVAATVDYSDGDVDVNEVSFEKELETGRSVTATLTPKSQNLEVEYKDDTFESGASWTATANVPLEDANNILDAAKLTLSRAWTW